MTSLRKLPFAAVLDPADPLKIQPVEFCYAEMPPHSAARKKRRFAGRGCFLSALLFVLGAWTNVALAQASNASWIAGPPADAFWQRLATSPYAQNGEHGMIIYMLSYSTCGNCIAFLRDFWEPRQGAIILREIFAPVNQPRYLNEAADVALTRDAAIANSYYHQTRTAPPVNSSPERQAALQRVVAFTTTTNAFLRGLGHVTDGFPTFIFRANDEQGRNKLMIVSGFGPDFARDLDRWMKEAAH